MARKISGTGAKRKRKGPKPRTKQTIYPSIYPKDHPLMSVTANSEIKSKAPAPLKANTRNQKIYLKKLRQRHHDILIVAGPAGTGKTYMAVRQAIEDYQNGEIDKIVITRPNVTTGDDLGYLPGTLTEKMAPWTRPIIDVFNECFPAPVVQRMIINEEIEIAPLAYMRGRTFKNCIVIADEMQNATPEQMKMLMTRIGENCRMIITGDTDQYDRAKIGITSGLADITRRLAERQLENQGLPDFITGGMCDITSGSPSGQYQDDRLARDDRRWDRIGLVHLGRADVVRHPVIEEVLALYDA